MIMARPWSDACMRVAYDVEANAAYVAFRHIEPREAVENLVIGRPDKGEIIGALSLAPTELLANAERLDR